MMGRNRSFVDLAPMFLFRSFQKPNWNILKYERRPIDHRTSHRRLHPTRSQDVRIVGFCWVSIARGDDFEAPIDLVAWIVRRETSTFWYRVSGNSLSRAGILDGDFVAIDRAGKVQPGRTVLAFHSGDMFLKVLTKRDGRMWLAARSDDNYPPIPVEETTEIWGVVAGIARRYPVE